SPMLSNLATVKLDISLSEYANKYGFTYTRYADDITLSCGGTLPDGVSVGKIKNNIISIIRKHHFKENVSKIRVAGPGSKKIVLGLLVDGNVPRLSKQTYKRIERHLYSIKKFGLSEVARHEKFDSPIGFYNHVAGLIAFVKDVDNARWLEFSQKFVSIDHP
ncbi:TPA: RNA-directed DNA polymerase, partial [Klebsiella pneumoniae]